MFMINFPTKKIYLWQQNIQIFVTFAKRVAFCVYLTSKEISPQFFPSSWGLK
jgi:hypothetical protein